MKERSLITFTILSQMAVGAMWAAGIFHAWLTRQTTAIAADSLIDPALLIITLIMIVAMLASFFHLGTPINAWRALRNIRSSWLSREILFTLLFTGTSVVFIVMQWFEIGLTELRTAIVVMAAVCGLGLIISMANAYRLRTVPAWNTWVTPVSFFITACLLGILLVGVMLIVVLDNMHPGWLFVLITRYKLSPDGLFKAIALGTIVLIAIEFIVIRQWLAKMKAGSEASIQSAAKITCEHGSIFKLRIALAMVGLVAAALLALSNDWTATIGFTVIAFGSIVIAEVLGRVLFYEARVRSGV
jgi:anaerobic dimethyl sulfoxide reductase subunit C (anchor subunit)